ncbi:MAG: class I SAM-dependent DNA methyltransferase [Chlorobi bacterium]|nr:class I SAM-dependent DNA methyltransferase [Chlorobiota bacterium]
MTPQEFVHKWKKSTLTERSASQPHFIDICQMIGHPTPADVDAHGESFTFEKGIGKQIGGKGFADVWKRGFFGWEYKGKHKDLDAAYNQLLNYREALQNPPLLVVSDMNRIVIHTNFTNTVKRVIELGPDDLLTPDGMRTLRRIFEEPESFKAEQTTEAVTAEAAKQFAVLSDMLRKAGSDPHTAAHFLIRLLFSLFAEDVGLLPNETLKRSIEATKRNPEEFARLLGQLFGIMATGGFFGLEKIPHFNGALFDDDSVLPLDRDALDIIETVSRMDWGSVEPSIFGTLFERSLDPAKRSQLGAHYTSREDILLIVEPVLMRPLRRRWEEVRAQAEELLRRREEDDTDRKKQNRQQELSRLLVSFAGEIGKVQVLDPACGSGNFLYMALRNLLDLEKEVIQYAGSVGVGTFFPSVNPAQLHGIEINPYAYELASVTIWIGYIQWLRDNGFGFPAEPILRRLDSIENRDAILAFDEEGKPYEPEWPAVDVIIGNPPFLGSRKMREVLGDSYCDSLIKTYSGRIEGLPDLVCYWFEKARQQIADKKTSCAGLIATQAIRAGSNLKVLERIIQTGGIFLAWSDNAWSVDGANVRVSIVGFDDGSEQVLQLDGNLVKNITPNLRSGLNLGDAVSLKENLQRAFQGVVPRGQFALSAEDAERMLLAVGNPNGRPNSDVIKPFISGVDIVRRPRNEFIIDFGVRALEEDASMYAAPFEYLREHVYPMRQTTNQKASREIWWIHWNSRDAMRKALSSLSRYIATPRVAKHRIFIWVPTTVLPDTRVYAIAREDDYFFGVLHSSIHEKWALVMASRHGVGNDPTYNAGSCFETFPFPYPPGSEPTGDPCVLAIGEAAKELVEKRDRWLNPEGATEAELKNRTLTNLYNQRPTWLDLAHKKLDNAVFDAYGWPRDLTEEQILERLLALNLERAGAA